MRKTHHRFMLGALVAAGATLIAVGGLTGPNPMLGVREADAVVGRPLTPVSYAGVARRTTRRAAYSGAYSGGYAAPVVATTAVVTTLPAGCARAPGLAYYDCGGARYEPYYNGPNLVYRPL